MRSARYESVQVALAVLYTSADLNNWKTVATTARPLSERLCRYAKICGGFFAAHQRAADGGIDVGIGLSLRHD